MCPGMGYMFIALYAKQLHDWAFVFGCRDIHTNVSAWTHRIVSCALSHMCNRQWQQYVFVSVAKNAGTDDRASDRPFWPCSNIRNIRFHGEHTETICYFARTSARTDASTSANMSAWTLMVSLYFLRSRIYALRFMGWRNIYWIN